jgi:hypothetical protein
MGRAIQPAVDLERLLRDKLEPMEAITIESIPTVLGREEDGRWWATSSRCRGAWPMEKPG